MGANIVLKNILLLALFSLSFLFFGGCRVQTNYLPSAQLEKKMYSTRKSDLESDAGIFVMMVTYLNEVDGNFRGDEKCFFIEFLSKIEYDESDLILYLGSKDRDVKVSESLFIKEIFKDNYSNDMLVNNKWSRTFLSCLKQHNILESNITGGGGEGAQMHNFTDWYDDKIPPLLNVKVRDVGIFSFDFSHVELNI